MLVLVIFFLFCAFLFFILSLQTFRDMLKEQNKDWHSDYQKGLREPKISECFFIDEVHGPEAAFSALQRKKEVASFLEQNDMILLDTCRGVLGQYHIAKRHPDGTLGYWSEYNPSFSVRTSSEPCFLSLDAVETTAKYIVGLQQKTKRQVSFIQRISKFLNMRE